MAVQQNIINHVALVLDSSSSMSGRRAKDLVRVADAQIKYLAERSQQLDQETRVSVYSFNQSVECLIFDKDVLRLPSIESLYRVGGATALIDATLKSQDDLDKTATMYGDHAFLTFVLTDGQENRSWNRPEVLRARLAGLPENYTVAVLVPDQHGVFEAKQFGFPRDNIAVWDTEGARGVEEAGATIRQATDNFMAGRAKGIRGTRSVFSTGVDAVNTQTVRSALIALPKRQYDVLPVHTDRAEIRPYVQSRGLRYDLGQAYYQLTKTERIQAGKKIIVRDRSTGEVYAGEQGRDLLGLPQGVEVRVKPEHNPLYDIFVQSTSVNRKLVQGTDLILLR